MSLISINRSTRWLIINTMIMTVYLWHITVMIIFVALLYLAGGFGLGLEPATAAWWYSRPIWIVVLLVLLVPVAFADRVAFEHP